MPLRIAIAVDAEHARQHGLRAPFGDVRLAAHLTASGHAVELMSWEEHHPALLSFDAIFVSSTWNACRAPDAFRAWLDRCEQDGRARLINSRPVLDVGFEKHRYWQLLTRVLERDEQLHAQGALTPTRFFVEADRAPDGREPLSSRTLAEVIDGDETLHQSNVVLKPIISADGINTFVFDRLGTLAASHSAGYPDRIIRDSQRAESVFATLARNQDMGGVIVQPYMSGVERGEFSLTVIGGVCTHAVQKRGVFGGGDHRALVALATLPRLVAFAEGLVSAVDGHFGEGSVSRARVDLFAQDNAAPALCEFECVEPNTNLAAVERDAPAQLQEIMTQYAHVIAARSVLLRG